MKPWTIIYIIVFLLNFSVYAEQVKIVSGKKSLSLDKTSVQFKDLWTEKKAFDDLSQQNLTYKGYPFHALIKKIQTQWGLPAITLLKVKAKDGYVVSLKPSQFQSEKNFLALDVLDLPEKGLYSKDLKYFVDWKPSYLVIDPKLSSSPYQVVEIEIVTENPKEFHLQFSKKYQAAAKIFAKDCLRCHGYGSAGGYKGPPLTLILKSWPSDEKLKAFIKDPKKFRENSGMSAYRGNDKSLDILISFLRYIENQPVK